MVVWRKKERRRGGISSRAPVFLCWVAAVHYGAFKKKKMLAREEKKNLDSILDQLLELGKKKKKKLVVSTTIN